MKLCPVLFFGTLVGMNDLRVQRNTLILALGLLSALAVPGCNLSDAGADAPLPGRACDEEGAEHGVLVCRDGAWVEAGAGDMSSENNTAMVDMGGGSDMTSGDMSCEGEPDAELCTSAGYECGVQQILDRCGVMRAVTCPPGCPMGESCNDQGQCAVTGCVPEPCPGDLMCGKIADGCGAMRLCDNCPDGSICNPDVLMCECVPTPEAQLCAESALSCGAATVMDCGAERDIDCGGCSGTNLCVANTCQQVVLTSRVPQAGERFGHDVALSGDVLVASEVNDETRSAGMLFERQADGSWARSAVFAQADHPEYDDALMGWSVEAALGEYVVLGKKAPTTEPNTREIKVWRKRQGGAWEVEATLQADPGVSRRMARDFGYALSASNTHLITGIPSSGDDEGAVRIFEWSSLGTSERVEPPPVVGGAELRYGEAVAIFGDTAAVGAPAALNGTGGVDVLRRSEGGWSSEQILFGFNQWSSGDRVGAALALGPDVLAVGMPGADVMEKADAGRVLIYTRSGGSWSEVAQLVAPNTEAGANFGAALALEGDLLVIGEPRADFSGTSDAGLVHVFALRNGAWGITRTITPSNPVEGMHFGHSVDLDGGLTAIGAPGAAVSGEDGSVLDGAGKVFLAPVQ